MNSSIIRGMVISYEINWTLANFPIALSLIRENTILHWPICPVFPFGVIFVISLTDIVNSSMRNASSRKLYSETFHYKRKTEGYLDS